MAIELAFCQKTHFAPKFKENKGFLGFICCIHRNDVIRCEQNQNGSEQMVFSPTCSIFPCFSPLFWNKSSKILHLLKRGMAPLLSMLSGSWLSTSLSCPPFQPSCKHLQESVFHVSPSSLVQEQASSSSRPVIQKCLPFQSSLTLAHCPDCCCRRCCCVQSRLARDRGK